MELYKFLLAALIAYLLGSINFAIIISRKALGVDIRNYGSGNAGSTNAYRTIGGKLAALVAAGDLTKGGLAVLVGYWLMGGDILGKLVGGVFVVIGHIYPVFFGFRGGKGVATTLALMLMIDWRIFLICGSLFLIVTLLTRYVSLASILMALCFPCAMAVFYQYNAACILLSLIISFLIVFMHRSNIKRLVQGKENKFRFSKPARIVEPEKKSKK